MFAVFKWSTVKLVAPLKIGLFLLLMKVGDFCAERPVFPTAFLLSTQLNTMVDQGLVAPNCVCVLKKSFINVLKDGRCGILTWAPSGWVFYCVFSSSLIVKKPEKSLAIQCGSWAHLSLVSFWVACCRRVVVILDLEVVRSAAEVDGKIGEPVPYVEGGSSATEWLVKLLVISLYDFCG